MGVGHRFMVCLGLWLPFGITSCNVNGAHRRAGGHAHAPALRVCARDHGFPPAVPPCQHQYPAQQHQQSAGRSPKPKGPRQHRDEGRESNHRACARCAKRPLGKKVKRRLRL